jgi:hypothetical protein
VSFAAITLRVASQRVFIVLVVYFVIDSARKLLDIPLYLYGWKCLNGRDPPGTCRFCRRCTSGDV